jgi:hypothetical protein
MKKLLIVAVFAFTAMSFTTNYGDDYPSDVCVDAAWAIDEACGGLSYKQFDSYYSNCLGW